MQQYLQGGFRFLERSRTSRARNLHAQRLLLFLTQYAVAGLSYAFAPLIFDLAKYRADESRPHPARPRLAAELCTDAERLEVPSSGAIVAALSAALCRARLAAVPVRGSVAERIGAPRSMRCGTSSTQRCAMARSPGDVCRRTDSSSSAACLRMSACIVPWKRRAGTSWPSGVSIFPEAQDPRRSRRTARSMPWRITITQGAAAPGDLAIPVRRSGIGTRCTCGRRDRLAGRAGGSVGVDLPMQLKALSAVRVPALALHRRRWDGTDSLADIAAFTRTLEGSP